MLKLGLTALLAAAFVVPSTAVRHLTLVDSNPREGATVAEAPKEIVLEFNEGLDFERRVVSLRGAAGPVSVGAVRSDDSTSFAVAVTGPMAPGAYTVSWLAGAPDHATIRGRYTFTLAPSR
jgi:methionine-rich copper-binding protein CopC